MVGLLASGNFFTILAALIMSPLLVELAGELNTSVASVGQLGGAVAITWAITAPLAGTLSDTYGRRRLLLTGVMLMGLGILGSGLAWNYGSLLAFRLLTGLGGAMVPPNLNATIADIFPAETRGKALGWQASSAGIGAAFGLAMVAFLLDLGGWRFPFFVFGGATLVLWTLLWVWLPQSRGQTGGSLSLVSHYREVASKATVWYVVSANSLLQIARFGAYGYLAAHLIQTYGLTAGETVLPLALAGLGMIVGGYLGGRISVRRRRLTWVGLAFLTCGLLAALVFSVTASPWLTVVLAFGVGSMGSVSRSILPALLMETAGNSRATAAGLFAVSNQVGVFFGASVGGLMLTLGGFPMVGFFCLGAAVAASVLMLIKVRDSAEFLERIALMAGQADSA